MSEQPWLRVERGAPTADELAAIVGVLLARRRAMRITVIEAPRPSAWRASCAPRAGGLPRPGPDAWRAAG